MTLESGSAERAAAAGDGRGEGGTGADSVESLRRFGRRYAAAVRVVVLGAVTVVALLRAGPEQVVAMATILAAVATWSGCYVWGLLHRRGRWVLVGDTAMLALVSLSIPWTDAVEQNNVGWIRLLVTFACIAHQWHARPLPGALATLVAAGTLVGVVALTAPIPDLLLAQWWTLVAAGLSRAAWTIVERAARAADRMSAQSERVRRDQRISSSARAEEWEFANALHDTAATTLMMVGTGDIRAGAGWLGPRARRDLAVLSGYGQRAPDGVDLVRLLRDDIEAIGVPVVLDAPGELPLPAPIGRAVAEAAREALNNAVRHARATRIGVRARGDARWLRVDIVDDGRGFAVDEVPAARRGLRECIHGRLRGIGGRARIVSGRGGTEVRLEWRATEAGPDGRARDRTRESIGVETRTRLLLGVRIAAVTITMASLWGLSLPNLLRFWSSYEAPVLGALAFGLLAGIMAGEVTLLLSRRSWGPARLPAVGVALGALALSHVALPAGSAASYVDWAFGAVNWVGVVVLLDRPLRDMAAFLALHESVALVNLLFLSEAGPGDLLRFATGTVGVIGYPLCVAVAAAALRTVAGSVASARWRLETARTAEAVAAWTHRRRRERLTELRREVLPLLRGFVEGTLDPEEEGVRRRCAVEAARMRRLFTGVDANANPLVHELRQCAEVAERKGVLVEMDVCGRWPDPPPKVRRDLTEAPLVALATAVSSARVTVVGDTRLVTVSVVADCGSFDPPRPATRGVGLEVLRSAGMFWVEVRWQATR